MSIKIRQPASFWEIGNRSNNEDSVYPPPGHATVQDRLFMVCDGVGGEHKGEVASSEACRCISDFIKNHKGLSYGPEELGQALEYTSLTFADIERNDPETHGMATTLTFLFLLENQIAIAHMGDSRIFQIREGKIIFQTRDHKLVNELVESGVITEEQAREHPKKNVITRVIQASRQNQADFKLIDDIEPGDYFFLCTDGVLERLYDGLLEYHLGQKSGNMASPTELMDEIKEECMGMTNDNFSAYLIQIESVGSIMPETTVAKSEKTLKPEPPPENSPNEHKSNGVLIMIAILIGLLLFGGTAYYFIQGKQDNTNNPDSLSNVMPDAPAFIESEQTPISEGTQPTTDKNLSVEKKPVMKVIKPKNTEGSNSPLEKPIEDKNQDEDNVQTVKQDNSEKALSDTNGRLPKQTIKTEKKILLKRERDSIPPKKSMQ